MEDIEYLEEYEDLVLPSINGSCTNASSAVTAKETRYNSDSSSIDPEIFDRLFVDISDDDGMLQRKVDPKLNQRRAEERVSLDSLDLLVRDLGEQNTSLTNQMLVHNAAKSNATLLMPPSNANEPPNAEETSTASARKLTPVSAAERDESATFDSSQKLNNMSASINRSAAGHSRIKSSPIQSPALNSIHASAAMTAATTNASASKTTDSTISTTSNPSTTGLPNAKSSLDVATSTPIQSTAHKSIHASSSIASAITGAAPSKIIDSTISSTANKSTPTHFMQKKIAKRPPAITTIKPTQLRLQPDSAVDPLCIEDTSDSDSSSFELSDLSSESNLDEKMERMCAAMAIPTAYKKLNPPLVKAKANKLVAQGSSKPVNEQDKSFSKTNCNDNKSVSKKTSILSDATVAKTVTAATSKQTVQELNLLKDFTAQAKKSKAMGNKMGNKMGNNPNDQQVERPSSKKREKLSTTKSTDALVSASMTENELLTPQNVEEVASIGDDLLLTKGQQTEKVFSKRDVQKTGLKDQHSKAIAGKTDVEVQSVQKKDNKQFFEKTKSIVRSANKTIEEKKSKSNSSNYELRQIAAALKEREERVKEENAWSQKEPSMKLLVSAKELPITTDAMDREPTHAREQSSLKESMTLSEKKQLIKVLTTATDKLTSKWDTAGSDKGQSILLDQTKVVKKLTTDRDQSELNDAMTCSGKDHVRKDLTSDGEQPNLEDTMDRLDNKKVKQPMSISDKIEVIKNIEPDIDQLKEKETTPHSIMDQSNKESTPSIKHPKFKDAIVSLHKDQLENELTPSEELSRMKELNPISDRSSEVQVPTREQSNENESMALSDESEVGKEPSEARDQPDSSIAMSCTDEDHASKDLTTAREQPKAKDAIAHSDKNNKDTESTPSKKQYKDEMVCSDKDQVENESTPSKETPRVKEPKLLSDKKQLIDDYTLTAQLKMMEATALSDRVQSKKVKVPAGELSSAMVHSHNDHTKDLIAHSDQNTMDKELASSKEQPKLKDEVGHSDKDQVETGLTPAKKQKNLKETIASSDKKQVNKDTALASDLPEEAVSMESKLSPTQAKEEGIKELSVLRVQDKNAQLKDSQLTVHTEVEGLKNNKEPTIAVKPDAAPVRIQKKRGRPKKIDYVMDSVDLRRSVRNLSSQSPDLLISKMAKLEELKPTAPQDEPKKTAKSQVELIGSIPLQSAAVEIVPSQLTEAESPRSVPEISPTAIAQRVKRIGRPSLRFKQAFEDAATEHSKLRLAPYSDTPKWSALSTPKSSDSKPTRTAPRKSLGTLKVLTECQHQQTTPQSGGKQKGAPKSTAKRSLHQAHKSPEAQEGEPLVKRSTSSDSFAKITANEQPEPNSQSIADKPALPMQNEMSPAVHNQLPTRRRKRTTELAALKALQSAEMKESKNMELLLGPACPVRTTRILAKTMEGRPSSTSSERSNSPGNILRRSIKKPPETSQYGALKLSTSGFKIRKVRVRLNRSVVKRYMKQCAESVNASSIVAVGTATSLEELRALEKPATSAASAAPMPVLLRKTATCAFTPTPQISRNKRTAAEQTAMQSCAPKLTPRTGILTISPQYRKLHNSAALTSPIESAPTVSPSLGKNDEVSTSTSADIPKTFIAMQAKLELDEKPSGSSRLQAQRAVSTAGTYSFLHAEPYTTSASTVMLDHCCPNLDGKMPALDPMQQYAADKANVLELPATIAMTTRLVTNKDLRNNRNDVPALIRQNFAILTARPHINRASSSQPATSSSAITGAGPITTASAAAVTPAISREVMPRGVFERQVHEQMLCIETLAKRHSDMLQLIDGQERRRISVDIANSASNRLNLKDMETTVFVLEHLISLMSNASKSSSDIAASNAVVATMSPTKSAAEIADRRWGNKTNTTKSHYTIPTTVARHTMTSTASPIKRYLLQSPSTSSKQERDGTVPTKRMKRNTKVSVLSDPWDECILPDSDLGMLQIKCEPTDDV